MRIRVALHLLTAALVAASCTAEPSGNAGVVPIDAGSAFAADGALTAGDAVASADTASKADTADSAPSEIVADGQTADVIANPVDTAATGVDQMAGDAAVVDSAPVADSGPVVDVTVAPDAAPTADGTVAGDVGAPQEIGPSPNPAVDQWGPYPVGTRVKNWIDASRNNRPVTTRLWYPIVEKSGDKATYLDAIVIKVAGKAIDKGSADKAKGPFPIVMFSHGFKGINWQSYDFTEYLASHGYVVAAPDHFGNTLLDVSVTKEVESKSALERPLDLRFAYDELVKLNGAGGGDFEGLLDLGKVAVTGHSFGGYTALVAGGGTVDVDFAKKGCETASNMLCKGGYMNYWPNGTVIKLPKPIPGLKAAICLAPGFHVAFGKLGLATVNVPTMVFGGSLDGTTPVASDITPIYNDLPVAKAKVVITGAGHMSYTNVCSLPPAQFVPELKDMCFKPGMIDGAKAFALTDAYTMAWLNRWLKGDLAMNALLTKELGSKFAAAQVSNQGF
ncbi:MAG: hypothetical protein EXR77_07045 [Myxococcales bacterium]|nr:hypothetical protein [Myxococcales bacterium]